MADKKGYPQIPSTVWWGVRSLMHRTPNATIDERLLGVQLGVQEAAAKQYINELRNVGILTEDGKPSPLAQKWRLDESYDEAVGVLINANYPESLINVAPPGEAERQKVVSWFLREGLGQGAAGNKAATYMLISSASPNEAPRQAAKSSAESPKRPRTAQQNSKINDPKGKPAASRSGGSDANATIPKRQSGEAFPLNVNVQIHISADAGTEQIESIFQAMRRYLYDAPDS